MSVLVRVGMRRGQREYVWPYISADPSAPALTDVKRKARRFKDEDEAFRYVENRFAGSVKVKMEETTPPLPKRTECGCMRLPSGHEAKEHNL